MAISRTFGSLLVCVAVVANPRQSINQLINQSNQLVLIYTRLKKIKIALVGSWSTKYS